MTAKAMLIGQRFGRLVVIDLEPARRHRERVWRCRCDCGGEKITTTSSLTGGDCRSCGCLRKENNTRMFSKHGGARTGKWLPEYRPWLNMKTRCRYENRVDFKYYGAQGVTIYEPWKTDFEAFRAHIGPRPTPQHSVDRIDPYGNYEPGNVRWATPTEQNRNHRKHAVSPRQGG